MRAVGPATNSGAASPSEERLPVLVLFVLAAGVFAAITTEVLPVGLLPQISRGLGTSESRVGLLVSAYAVVVVVVSLPLTALVARWPRRRVLCVLLLGYAVSSAILATTSSYPVALAARLLAGVAHAGFFSVVFTAAVAVVPPGRAGRAIAAVGAGNALALALGVPLGTALGAALGWRWAFAGTAGVLAVLALATAVSLPAAPGPASSVREPVLAALRGRGLQRVAVTIVLLTLGHYTLYTYVTPLLLHAGLAPAVVSLALLGYGAAGVAGLVVASAVVDRSAHRGLQGAAVLLLGCLLALGLLGHSAGATTAVVVIWGSAFGALPTLLQAVALRATSGAPEAAPAVVNTTFNIGIAGGGLIGSRELLHAPPPVLALTGAALVAAALVLLWVSSLSKPAA